MSGRGYGANRGGFARGRGGGRGGRGGGSGGGGTPNAPPKVYTGSVTTHTSPSSTVKQIEEALQLSVKSNRALKDEIKFPVRPGYGKNGTSVILWANYFELKPLQNLTLFRYDVSVTPKAAGKKLVQIIRLALEAPNLLQLKGDLVSDFKSTIISRKQIAAGDLSLQIQYRKENEDEALADATVYEVNIVKTNDLSVPDLLAYLTSTNASKKFPDAPQLVQAFNIFLKHHAKTSDNFLSVGSNKSFPHDADSYDLSAGLRAIRGFYSSVRLATARILVNVNVSHGAFYTPGPLNELINFLSEGSRPRYSHHQLQGFLRRLKITTTHLPRKLNRKGEEIPRIKTISGLANQQDGRTLAHPPQVPSFGAGPKHVKFWVDQKGQDSAGKGASKWSGKTLSTGYLSVYDFFLKAHNIQLRYPALPVVNTGTRENPIYLPPEVCQILRGQSYNRKLDPTQTQKMIDFAVRTPDINASSITRQGLRASGLDSNSNLLLQRFGFTIQPELIKVPARVLGPPILEYVKSPDPSSRSGSIPSEASQAFVSSGNWNLRNMRFKKAARVPRWASLEVVIAPRNPQPGTVINDKMQGNFYNKLKLLGIEMGVLLATQTITLKAPDDPLLEEFIQRASRAMELLVVILPEVNTVLYNRVKTLGDVKYGVHTVCCVSSKLLKPKDDNYIANVGLKINLKFGGTNHFVTSPGLKLIDQDKTMVVGIDVTHPSPGSASTAPSVAGMVASVDKHLGQFPAILKVQASRQENVSDLSEMLASRLDLWMTLGKHPDLPENILVYRDGVSEGQYAMVVEEELKLLQGACRQKYRADQQSRGLPRISIIIVGKRHHTRFYPTSTNDAEKGNNNTKPGTVVDRGVTAARNWDFFLQPHAAIQGTARPAHYYVVYDEIFRFCFGQPQFQHTSVADMVEDLTHSMAYTYGRATKAVSLCPPAYYADILCERARCYLSHVFEPPSSGSSSTSSSDGPAVSREDVVIHPKLKDSMFYI